MFINIVCRRPFGDQHVMCESRESRAWVAGIQRTINMLRCKGLRDLARTRPVHREIPQQVLDLFYAGIGIVWRAGHAQQPVPVLSKGIQTCVQRNHAAAIVMQCALKMRTQQPIE